MHATAPQLCLTVATNFPTLFMPQLRVHNMCLQKHHSDMLQHGLLTTYLQLETTTTTNNNNINYNNGNNKVTNYYLQFTESKC